MNNLLPLNSVRPLEIHSNEISRIVGTKAIVVSDTGLLAFQYRKSTYGKRVSLLGGSLEDGETLEECIERELYEEGGIRHSLISSKMPLTMSKPSIKNDWRLIYLVILKDTPVLHKMFSTDKDEYDPHWADIATYVPKYPLYDGPAAYAAMNRLGIKLNFPTHNPEP